MLRSRFLISSLCLLGAIYTGVFAEEIQQKDKEQGLTIHLNRQKTAFEQHLNNAPLLKKHGLNMEWVYKKHHPGNRTNDSIPLYRYIDNEFYGTVVVGHPGQILNVAFDTAWSVSWVISSRCSSFKNVGCMFHKSYNHDKSSEYRADGRKYQTPEGAYTLKGFFSYDNISISHSNVTNFSFVEMTDVPYTYLFSKVDGVFGLALPTDSYTPFFYTLLQQKKIIEPIFCVYLNRDKQSNHGGNVIMGFLEKRHIHHVRDQNNNIVYDEVTYLPIKNSSFWQFDLDAVYINKTKETPITFCKGAGCTAITDTSSNNILGPKDDIDQIHDAINAKPFYLDRYTVNCDTINKLPTLGFTIGGKNFTLKGPDYTVKLSYMSVTVCLSAFVPHEYNNFWVLGGAFLSEYYTIYNVKDKTFGVVKSA